MSAARTDPSEARTGPGETVAATSRRRFLQASMLAAGALSAGAWRLRAARSGSEDSSEGPIGVGDLPTGGSPRPVAIPHFPDRLHAFIWRNWTLVPVARIAGVIGASRSDILRLGRSMGLPDPPRITRDQLRRSTLTVIRRNWHLLNYEQLLALLDWTPRQLAFSLREDDFLFIKLGSLKPACAQLRYAPPDQASRDRAAEISRIIRREFPDGFAHPSDELFAFVARLTSRPRTSARRPDPRLTPRFCYSYFALYGDPLMEAEADPYPEGYLARLAESGVDGVWLQALLHRLAPCGWEPSRSAGFQERLRNLGKLVERARRHGIGVWLYLNEPRAMPLKFFDARPELKGVVEGDYAALCTSHPDVRRFLSDAVGRIVRTVPDLAGFFTITASENLSNCWSHGGGKNCARCAPRQPAEVIAEVNTAIQDGLALRSAKSSGPAPRLIAWDWGWEDAWAQEAIERLPREATLMSVSEWSLPIDRGGVKTVVGEYSISAIGPGPRATRHWQYARKRGLRTLAKIQAGNTWELSAVPYIPAIENVARHAMALREAGVDGLMLGWTLGGYPSPNLEVVAEVCGAAQIPADPSEPMRRVAERRFGDAIAPAVVTAWRRFSAAFSEFPFHGGVVYSAPLQLGPANPLWGDPTGYRSSMVGFPYDDMDGWRAVYPAETLISQLEKVANGFDSALAELTASAASLRGDGLDQTRDRAFQEELTVAEAAAIHFRSVANQSRFILARDALTRATTPQAASRPLANAERALNAELELAKRLHRLQSRDSRIGFEASNQYYYVPMDLAEKVLNCRDLLDRWLPAQRALH